MNKLLLILISFLFTTVLVSGRQCDPADPLIKFMRELKNARKECASLLGEPIIETVISTTSVDASPTTFFTEIDHETTISKLYVARLTNTVEYTETNTVTSVVYGSTSYSTIIVTVTSVPPPQTRTSTAIQTITVGGITTYYTITITVFQTTAAAATLPSSRTSGLSITTHVTYTATTTIKSSLAASAKSSQIVPSSDYSTTTTGSPFLSSAPVISTKPIFSKITGSNLTSKTLGNSASGTERASSLQSSTPILSIFIPPTTITTGTGTSPSVPYPSGCTVYTTTIVRPGIPPQTSIAGSSFTTLGSAHNTSITTKKTNSSAPFTLYPSPSPSSPAGPSPVMNRWRRFNIQEPSSTTHSDTWISRTNAVMTAAPIIPENGIDTVRLYDRHPGDTSSACSCIMPFLISQPKVTHVITETIPPRMIWITKTKVFTTVHLDGTITLTSTIVQQTTEYATEYHTNIKEAVTTESITIPGIANSAVVVTVTSTTTVHAPVTSTITKYTTIDR